MSIARLFGKDSSGKPIEVWVDPTTHELLVKTTATFTEAAIASSVPTAHAITLGGTAELAAAANSKRIDLFITNISDTIMYLTRGATAIGEAGIPLDPKDTVKIGAEWKGVVSILCATTGKKYTTEEGSSA